MTDNRSIAERFWAKVQYGGSTPETAECWEWTGSISIGGRYGAFSLDHRMRPAHRVAWEMTSGPVPPGLELDHLCRNTRCVRPDHLEPVTHAENMRRSAPAQELRDRGYRCKRHPEQALVRRSGDRICVICRRDANVRYRRAHGSAATRSEGLRRAWADRTAEERAEISQRIWETRRRNASPRGASDAA